MGAETNDEDTVHFDGAARSNAVERRTPPSDAHLAVDREDVVIEANLLLSAGGPGSVLGYAGSTAYRSFERAFLVGGVLGEEGRGGSRVSQARP